ncbi:hypothetical protein L4D18_21595 [Vibrio campbellii]|uniref:hypothetical protein n=1 Tax=Vibrio campbellii TaxID=680 RepID=UPI003D0D8B60
MKTVKCFKHDSWLDINATDLANGDIFTLQGQTYVATGKPYVSDGALNIPSEVYDSGPIVISLEKGQDYIHMAMDYVSSSAQDFGDGTMQICEFEDGNTNVYSPRLPIAELNDFCKKNIAQYKAFFAKHEQQLDAGDVIAMPKFW